MEFPELVNQRCCQVTFEGSGATRSFVCGGVLGRGVGKERARLVGIHLVNVGPFLVDLSFTCVLLRCLARRESSIRLLLATCQLIRRVKLPRNFQCELPSTKPQTFVIRVDFQFGVIQEEIEESLETLVALTLTNRIDNNLLTFFPSSWETIHFIS